MFNLVGGGAALVLDLDGLASDSSSATGTWRVGLPLTGTFTAARSTDTHFITLSGDWSGLLDGASSSSCTISFQQNLLTLDASVDCNTLGSGQFTGSIDPVIGGVGLQGSLGGVQMFFNGRGATDGTSFVGELRPPQSVTGHQLIAVPTAQLSRGIVAVDCYPMRAGLQTECGALENKDLTVALDVIATPPDLAQPLVVGLSWQTDRVIYHPTADVSNEVSDGQCAKITRTVEADRVLFSCSPAPSFGPGPLVALTLTCLREASHWHDLPELNAVQDTGVSTSTGPILIDALLTPCAGPTHGGYRLGDANCDRAANSIDSALVLQFDGGILGTLACSRAADVNRDESVNSIDASLILQCSAGLTNVCQ